MLTSSDVVSTASTTIPSGPWSSGSTRGIHASPALHARNDVRALVAKEDRDEHLELTSGRGDRRGAHGQLDALGRELHVALDMRVGHAPREIGEQLVERGSHAAVERIAPRDRQLVASRLGIRLGQHVLDVRVHTHRREHAARDGAEERLGDLAVVAIDDERAVQPLHLLPGRDVGGERAQLVAHVLERLEHVRAVERKTRRGVVLRADPVASLEAIAHAARDRREARDERVERIGDGQRRSRGGLVAVHVLRQHISRIGTH